MDRDQKVRFTFYRDVPYDYEPEHLIFEDELEESDAAIPPTYPWEGTWECFLFGIPCETRIPCLIYANMGSLY